MFCPSCGRDCGNSRFCTFCGSPLQQAVQKALVPCPHCGGTLLEGTSCAFCGRLLIHKVPPQHASQNPKRSPTAADFPFNSSYIGVKKTFLDVNETSVTISPILGYKHKTEIPFDQLATVIFLRPYSYGWKKMNGVLLFRGEANRDLPIPEIRKMETDTIAIIVPSEKATIFFHVFYMLKAVAPSSARFELVLPAAETVNLDKLSHGIDLDYFFNTYAPHRELAARGIAAKHDIQLDAARLLVDRFFDARQKSLYDANPFHAVNDLNLVVAKADQELQRKQKQQADIRKRREQDELTESIQRMEHLLHRMDKK